ncbi:M23 family metallopeptidase [Streptomyces polyrhachis]|uniref:M23 family metallopeptidase n=1 Tax=Streptomyces polyrhachis TaxID=1282885 RepID=A0ABW2GE46_9ACTN
MRPLQTALSLLLSAAVALPAAPAVAAAWSPSQQAGVARPAQADPPDDRAAGLLSQVGRYRVRSGDTLSSVAERLGQPWQLLYRQNRSTIGADPGLLLADRVLVYTPDSRPPLRGWAAPLVGGRISAAYGIKGKWWAAGHHTGVDLAVPTGRRVRSVGPGRVVEAGRHAAYGTYAKVLMDDGHYVLYAHLSRLDVSYSQRVRGGSMIGLSGNTGQSTGPHLHFEVRSQRGYGSDVDPLRYLAKRRIWL